MAVYHHDTSRELDPQIHTHAVGANLTFDGVEGRWKALQAPDIYECRAYLTEVYRNVLAREVRALGYEIDNRRDSKGRDSGFEICGFPKNCSKSSANGVISATARSRSSSRRTGASRPTMRSQSWLGNRAPISCPRSQPVSCGINSGQGLPQRMSVFSPQFGIAARFRDQRSSQASQRWNVRKGTSSNVFLWPRTMRC